ncbi:MAG TPA: PilZ domain-containing protein [Treponemataceae bacterium]|nr:PilZ domain-containing protein [Treponemataceae bacterium]
MGYATSQQLARYYELYQNIDVTFSKEVIKATGLIPQQVYVKALGGQWPCVVNSASLSGAKIISGIKSGFYEKIQQGNTSVSLRLSFQDPEKSEPMSFFVTSKITGFTQYAGSPDLIIINIAYTQRPPDDLIEKLGALLEANINSTKRREERIVMTPDAMRKLGILQKETVIFIQGIPRRCIIRDLSFSGSKVIMVGIAPFLINKEVVLRIDIAEPRLALGVKGTIVRTEDVEGRKDLVALAIKYHEAEIPMGYKMQINAYLSQMRKTALHDAEEADGANAPKHAHEGHASKDEKTNSTAGSPDAATNAAVAANTTAAPTAGATPDPKAAEAAPAAGTGDAASAKK